jgi:hypothetical protein
MSCERLSLLMNVTWLPSGTMMFFGVTALLAIVIVVVATAPGGVVGGVVTGGEGDASLLPPQAAMAHASPHAAKNAASMRDLIVSLPRVSG